MQLPNNPSQSPETFCNFVEVHEAQRFDLRFLRLFCADLSIRKSSSFFPPLIAAPPALDDDLGLAESVEDFAVEQLVAQASVEAPH